MWDLVVGIVILLAASAGLFVGGMKLARRCHRRYSVCAAVLALVFLLVFGLLIHGKLLVAKIVPFSGAIVVGNWIPLGAAVLCGIIAGQGAVPRWRRVALAAGLAGLAWYTVLCNFLREPPAARDVWSEDGVCLQSSPASCSPCCAATLLRHCGIPASEGEMIDLCLTRKAGTPSLGVYRGLMIKTRETDWRVEVVRGDCQQLHRASREPVLLRIRLDRSLGAAPGFLQRWGWSAEISHAVVFYGFTDGGKAEVGDPAAGRERLSAEELSLRWRGEGLRLVRR